MYNRVLGVANDSRKYKQSWTIERHRLKIPTLGFVRLKEKGYIPNDSMVKSGTVSIKAGRYYVSVLTEADEKPYDVPDGNGIGIDLGIKDFAVVNTIENPFANINKTKTVRDLEKSLRANKESFRENTKV